MSSEEPQCSIADHGGIKQVFITLGDISGNQEKIWNAIQESAGAIAKKASEVITVLRPGDDRVIAQVFGLPNEQACGRNQDGSVWLNPNGQCTERVLDTLPMEILRRLTENGIHAVLKGSKLEKNTDFILIPETYPDAETQKTIVFNLLLQRLSRISKFRNQYRILLTLVLAGGMAVAAAASYWFLREYANDQTQNTVVPEKDH